MDRFRQKSKNDKPLKHVDKEKPAIFITDVKTIKENLKIKEILRSVKMNSSMRMKAPRGSVVMNNNDFSDVHEEDAEGIPNVEAHNETLLHPQEVNNAHVNSENKSETQDGSGMNDSNELPPDNTAIYDRHESDENLNTDKSNLNVPDIDLTSIGQDKNCNVKCRERKLSLDHTMLSRREGLSPSDVDLHSIGKSPLERKSSFFRKKMDSFLKNTSEIFKRQSSGTKPTSINRRSSISVSLQSLSENATMDSEIGSISKSNLNCHQAVRGSRTSINSLSTVGALSELGSSGSQAGSQPIQNDPKENSLNNLNEAHLQDSLLNSRAISMSSGLDSALGQRRRKSSRSNRVTWVASEGLTNYLRRLTQDESTKEMHSSHSYQDFSSISESSLQSSKADSKGRRLSYQRAVSGEDPVMPLRYQDSTLRKRHLIPENSEANYELSNLLAEFSRNGVPELQGYSNSISDAAYSYLLWAEDSRNIEEFYDWKKLNPNEDARQAVIRELISTEALYIRHLISIVEVFIAAAHAIQDSGKMLGVDTERLFFQHPRRAQRQSIFLGDHNLPDARRRSRKCHSF